MCFLIVAVIISSIQPNVAFLYVDEINHPSMIIFPVYHFITAIIIGFLMSIVLQVYL